jgi:hypothetical protein
MSYATCYSGSNNIHFNFPPIMADGRNWASWQPEAVVNNRIQKHENIKTNWEYRQYMQKNGLQIMKFNSTEACYELGLDPHTVTSSGPATNVPFTYKSSFDASNPGYGYQTSDLKNPYLTREQLSLRLISPSITPANIIR